MTECEESLHFDAPATLLTVLLSGSTDISNSKGIIFSRALGPHRLDIPFWRDRVPVVRNCRVRFLNYREGSEDGKAYEPDRGHSPSFCLVIHRESNPIVFHGAWIESVCIQKGKSFAIFAFYIPGKLPAPYWYWDEDSANSNCGASLRHGHSIQCMARRSDWTYLTCNFPGAIFHHAISVQLKYRANWSILARGGGDNH